MRSLRVAVVVQTMGARGGMCDAIMEPRDGPDKTSHERRDVRTLNEPGLAEQLLSSARTIAVVGYSDKPFRPVTSVSAYLRSAGFRTIPVNPRLRGRVVD